MVDDTCPPVGCIVGWSDVIVPSSNTEIRSRAKFPEVFPVFMFQLSVQWARRHSSIYLYHAVRASMQSKLVVDAPPTTIVHIAPKQSHCPSTPS
eukprot:7202197-Pyramimonas_sp.AAC.1